MKILLVLLLVTFVAVVYGCHNDAGCHNHKCLHNQEPFCRFGDHHGHHGHDVTTGTCDCRHIVIIAKRAGHRECSAVSDCAGFCTTGIPACTTNAHHDHNHNHCVCHLCVANSDCTGTCDHGGNMHCTTHPDHGHHHCTCHGH